MDAAKKAKFIQKFAKGGLVRRKNFADGGTTLGSPGSTTNASNTNPNSGVLGTLGQGLGLNNNFQAQSANIQQGTNAAQLNNAYTGVQGGLTNQGNLVNTLTPQAATGVASQNALSNELLAMSQGQGPNPAQAELAQATGQNVAQTGAEMAGMRGASGNVGLLARQIGQQGAATQQNAAGQAATLEAQQQIAAQQNLANLANNQISQTGQAVTGQNSAQQNEQSILQNANTSANNAAVGMQSNINNTNAQTSAANQNMNANILGGITSAASNTGAISSLFGAKGGEVTSQGFIHPHMKLAEMNARSLKHFDEGGEIDAPNLGTFKAGDDSASAPNVASTSSLPSAPDLSSSTKSSGGGGGGAGGLMALAALANGGQIQANPLTAGTQINGPGTWTNGLFNSGSASSGPQIGSESALPAATTNFSKVVSDAASNSKSKKQSSSAASPTAQSTYDWMNTPGPSQDQMSTAAWMQAPSEGQSGTVNPASGSFEPDIDAPQTLSEACGGKISTGPHKSHVMNYLMSEGGKVPAMVSPGEIYLSPEKVRKVIQEGIDPAKIGEKFKGKAKVKGDSIENDTIPRDLEEGGVVIDRKNMGTREKRELFVHRAIARKNARA